MLQLLPSRSVHNVTYMYQRSRYVADHYVAVNIYSACLSLLIHTDIHLLEHFHFVLSTFYYNSSFLELLIHVVYYASKFQSDMLYLLKL